MTNDSSMSELESELEMELEQDREAMASEFEGEAEAEQEFELHEAEAEFEGEFEGEAEFEGPVSSGEFADRFLELAEREFESPAERELAVDRLVHEMEQEFFWKGLAKKLLPAGKALLNTGLKLAKGTPIGQVANGVTQLARGNLKGALGSLGKAALGSGIIPGGQILVPALSAMGFEAEQPRDARRQAWNTYVNVSRRAYSNLAKNLTPAANQPAAAAAIAQRALNTALRSVGVAPGSPPRASLSGSAAWGPVQGSLAVSAGGGYGASRGYGGKRKRYVRLGRNDVLIITQG
ncbi:MAG: hypothetical protein LC623_03870 [Halobacteriales archaeon]|nr:hypothetical protein [Halobacteriales archaeon]